MQRSSQRRRLQSVVALAAIAMFATSALGSPASAWEGHGGSRCRSGAHRADRASDVVEKSFRWLEGYDDPATPDQYDRVGVLRVGSRWAHNVLILNPGTSAGSAYFVPLAEDIVRATHGDWQIWSVERRENQLEDHSVLNALKHGTVTPQAVVRLLPAVAQRPVDHQPFPVDPRRRSRVRARLGA